VLPTGGAARFAGALRVDDFRRHVHIVETDRAGLAAVGRHVEALARAEGLDAHARSVGDRLAPRPAGSRS
jgi:histidinol dehydrogenase